MMKRAESRETKASRQCWECLKRRLVCDHTLPHCQKCIKAGRDCPGYDENKPLQWVAPGKVTSRTRKKNPPKVYTIRASEPIAIVRHDSSTDLAPAVEPSASVALETVIQDDSAVLEWTTFEEPLPSREAIELYKSQLAAMLIHEDNADWWHSLTSEEKTEYVVKLAQETSAGVGVAERFMMLGSQKKLKELVERGQDQEAAVLLRSNRNPLDRLKRLLWIMEMNHIPSYDNLTNETSEVVQAVSYCKSISWAMNTIAVTLIPQRQHQDLPRCQRN